MNRRIEEPGPGAGFATRDELAPYQWTPEAFYLGETAPEVVGLPTFEIGLDDDRGVFIVAGTRGGKGTSLLVPNLIGWPGGAFCIDVKGELASLTATRRGTARIAKKAGTTVRHHLGQQVAILDPLAEVKGPARIFCTGYNPLSELDPDSPSFVREVRRIARALVVRSKDQKEPFWLDMAAILIAGVIEAVMVAFPDRMKNLATVRNVIVQAKMMKYLAMAAGRPLVQEALGTLEMVGDREAGSFHSTLVTQWAWLADPNMQASVMDKSGFSLTHAVQEGGTVYVCMPFNDLEDQKRWLRLMLVMALNAKIRRGVYRRGERHTLFVIDEMAALGPMDMLEDGMGYLSGFGVKAVSVVQNLGQLKSLYERNWQTFLGNTGAIAGFSFNDDETPEHFSKKLGHYEFMEQAFVETENETMPEWLGSRGLLFTPEKVRDHESKGGKGLARAVNTARKVEPVLRPEQVRIRTSRTTNRMIVFPADGRPMLLARVPFYERFSTAWYEHEENILRIETLTGKQKRLTSGH